MNFQMEKLAKSTKLPNFSANTESQTPVNSDLAELYMRALQGKEPRDGEFDAWLNVIGGYPSPDVDAAIRRWQSDTYVEEFTGRPRGARMPTAVELKASIDSWNNASAKKFVSCGSCEGGWIRVFEGLTVGSSAFSGRPIDKNHGAMRRCKCFNEYMAARLAQNPAPTKRKRLAGLKSMEAK